MKLPTREKIRYHATRWVWVPFLALVAHVSFPSGAADVAPLLEPGARSDKEIVAPFNFVVNKSEDELQREAEELAASAKPIYEFRQRAYDSTATTMAAFFTAVDAAADQGQQAIISAAGEFGVPVTPQEAAYLSKGGKRRAVQQALQKLFDRTLAQGVTGPGVVGPLLRYTLLLPIFWVLLVFYRRETYTDLRPVALIGALFAILLLQAGIVARSYPEHPTIIFMPFVAMMMTVLFNGRVSMIAAMILAVVIGLQPVFHDVPALFLCLIGGVTAALSVRALRSRSNFYAPVLIIAAGYLMGALALGLSGGWPIAEIGLRGLLGALNGLVSAGLTFFLLPVAESVTHITTDLTLLELSDPSRPLLRRLSLEAPGTYAHSVAMANLVEAACNRIGANGLLGRVGCYYHDIGKVKNPLYFVEN